MYYKYAEHINYAVDYYLSLTERTQVAITPMTVPMMRLQKQKSSSR